MNNWIAAILLGLVILTGAGNLIATYRVVQDSRHQRTEQVCTTLGQLVTEMTTPDGRRLLNAWGDIYNCDWSHK